MTRKDYKQVATILRDERATAAKHSGIGVDYIDDIAKRLADMFAEDNPRFDRERFFAAVRDA